MYKRQAIASGIEEILIITGRSKKCIEDHFDKSVELEMELEKSGKNKLLDLVRDISDMVDIHYIRQKEPRGLGHAIHCAKTFVGDEPFAIPVSYTHLDVYKRQVFMILPLNLKIGDAIEGIT